MRDRLNDNIRHNDERRERYRKILEEAGEIKRGEPLEDVFPATPTDFLGGAAADESLDVAADGADLAGLFGDFPEEYTEPPPTFAPEPDATVGPDDFLGFHCCCGFVTSGYGWYFCQKKI